MLEEENNFFKKITPNKPPDEDSIKWIIISALVSCVMIYLIVLVSVSTNQGKNIASQLQPVKSVAKRSWTSNFKSKPENILLLGVDSNGVGTDPFKYTRSDTMIVFNIDKQSKTVNAVSIPRDSKVYISEKNYIDKINAAHAIGGANLAIKTIEQTLGFKIDHYVVVNYNGVMKLIDAIGGVPVDVKKRMYYIDRTAGLYIDLQPGEQVLTSKTAQQYLRFRHDSLGDIGRVKRQQHFLSRLAQKFQSPLIISKIPSIIKIASQNIKTDMTPVEMAKYASMAKSIKLEKTQIATLPGAPNESGEASYWILDSVKTQEVIDRLIYRLNSASKDSDLKVSLSYQKNIAKEVQSIKENLKNKGYNVVCTYKTQEHFPQIIAHTNGVSFDKIKNILKIIPSLKNAQRVVSFSGYRCADSDVTLVITDN